MLINKILINLFSKAIDLKIFLHTVDVKYLNKAKLALIMHRSLENIVRKPQWFIIKIIWVLLKVTVSLCHCR